MAHLDVKMTYQAQLTPAEFRLVLRALLRKLSPAEEQEAAELGNKLAELRTHHADIALKASARWQEEGEKPQ